MHSTLPAFLVTAWFTGARSAIHYSTTQEKQTDVSVKDKLGLPFPPCQAQQDHRSCEVLSSLCLHLKTKPCAL